MASRVSSVRSRVPRLPSTLTRCQSTVFRLITKVAAISVEEWPVAISSNHVVLTVRQHRAGNPCPTAHPLQEVAGSRPHRHTGMTARHAATRSWSAAVTRRRSRGAMRSGRAPGRPWMKADSRRNLARRQGAATASRATASARHPAGRGPTHRRPKPRIARRRVRTVVGLAWVASQQRETDVHSRASPAARRAPGREGPRRLHQPEGLHPGGHRVRCGPGQHLAVPVRRLRERRRSVRDPLPGGPSGRRAALSLPRLRHRAPVPRLRTPLVPAPGRWFS